MASLDPYLKLATQRGAKQLLLLPGQKPTLVFDEGKTPIGQPIHPSQIAVAVLQILSDESKAQLKKSGSVETAYETSDFRYEVEVCTQDGSLQATFTDTPVTGRNFEPNFEPIPLCEDEEEQAPERVEAPQEVRKASVQPAMVDVASSGDRKPIELLLIDMIKRGASDLHLCSGRRPRHRIDGDLLELKKGEKFNTEHLQEILFEIVRPDDLELLKENGSCDFSYEIPMLARFRFNIYKDNRGIAAAVRQIPVEIMSAEKLGLPPQIRALAALSKGLVLVTGPTGSGKSTTLAAIVDLVNRSRNDHIITIESPIEFIHQDKKCLVNQREVGDHTVGFKDALRDALREDPDIVLVGEMRDLETIETAIETASTGHLVFGTLHTTTATSTVNRIIDIFPADQQAQVRYGLAESLKAVVAQTLLKKIGGGRIAALETLIVTKSVSNLIREQKTHQLLNQMQTGRKLGMQLLNDELVSLVAKGIVEAGEAYGKAVDKDDLIRQYNASGIEYKPGTDEFAMDISSANGETEL